MKRIVLALLVALGIVAAFAEAVPPKRACASVSSPDGSLEIAFCSGPDGMSWSLARNGKTLVAPSRLGLSFALLRVRGRELGEMRVVDKKSRSSDTVWSTGT